MTEMLTGLAPAKINLVLEVLGRREDGHHEIDTVLQTLVLADEVVLRVGAGATGIEIAGPYAEGTPADDTNLVVRARATRDDYGPRLRGAAVDDRQADPGGRRARGRRFGCRDHAATHPGGVAGYHGGGDPGRRVRRGQR
jgi:hypothetical protein